MSGPPPPPPPPGPPPPPAMAPPQMSKSEQHGRSALLTDISKGTRLKSAKHLMNDRSGVQVGGGGNAGKGGGGPGAGIRPVMPPGCENGRSAGRGPPPAGGRQPHAGGGGAGGGGGASGTGTVRNAPPGLGDLFGGGMPKLRGTGSNTVGRSAGSRGGDRVSNGSVENFPPPPPLSSKPSADFPDSAPSTVGRSSGSRVSGGGFPPPPSPSQLSRPLPGVPGPRPSGPPPPPTRAPPPSRPTENGQTNQGYNTRSLPQTPSLPPKPPERKDSVAPPPPPFRAANGPPPPPTRGPGHAPLPVRPPGGPGGRSGPPTGPPPPPGPTRATNAPPPPPPGRPPVSVSRTNSSASSASEFEAMFQFPTDLPHPDHFTPTNKTYPSQHPNRKASTNTNRRPVPPPPPPFGS